jgi:hypothetical protein
MLKKVTVCIGIIWIQYINNNNNKINNNGNNNSNNNVIIISVLAGLEPATFRLTVECTNQLCYKTIYKLWDSNPWILQY